MNSHNPTDSRDAAVDAVPPPFHLRSRFITAVVVKLAGPLGEPFYSALDLMIRQAPHFFVGAPLVIDVELAQSLQDKADFLRLAREMRNRRLFAIGIQNGSEAQSVAASHAGLLALQGGRDSALEKTRPNNRRAQDDAGGAAAPEPAAAAAADPATAETLIVTDPVRSGQRVFAGNGDLIVVNSVSAGAELVAHGNIHVYGAMRGRALAGVNGDTSARIFCQSLEAELIAIAGLYKSSDDFDPSVLKQRTQAYLQDDTLCLDILK